MGQELKPKTRFGDWAIRNNNTIYQENTDGIVCAYRENAGTILGFTDGATPPTIQRVCHDTATGGAYICVTMPVKRNDYWKVTGSVTVFWIPLI